MITHRIAAAVLTLVGMTTLTPRGYGQEVIPPLRPVGEGVPKDLPALGPDQFAVVRLIINGCS